MYFMFKLSIVPLILWKIILVNRFGSIRSFKIHTSRDKVRGKCSTLFSGFSQLVSFEFFIQQSTYSHICECDKFSLFQKSWRLKFKDSWKQAKRANSLQNFVRSLEYPREKRILLSKNQSGQATGSDRLKWTHRRASCVYLHPVFSTFSRALSSGEVIKFWLRSFELRD